ncbi:unnamed protein product [Spirodela intermedia]|uniref:Uncharacterized protein n=1 Tax=Spirodela intermedia TaxID=51605 RepID=A0A7I8IND1_SPIIN|nr:unnamed protein product [Spirodela intermedia]CAA6658962.1 unnamed protein product [Spirodela intermedia]
MGEAAELGLAAAAPPPHAHALIVPYPSQGHINPMLQFAKRLASRGGPRVTLVTTRFILLSLDPAAAADASVGLVAISDGYDRGGVAEAPSLDDYLRSLDAVGSQTLATLIEHHRGAGAGDGPFTCVVYDTYAPWAAAVASRLALPAVAFSTQSCTASAVYCYVGGGLLQVPEDGSAVISAEGLPSLCKSELPSLAAGGSGSGAYPMLAALSLSQFSRLGKNDWVLVNSFEELEPQVVDGLKLHMKALTVGPTVPEGDGRHGMDLLRADAACLRWLDGKPAASVVYVSFGSFACLSAEQTAEIAHGLRDSRHEFLWVVRGSEQGSCRRASGRRPEAWWWRGARNWRCWRTRQWGASSPTAAGTRRWRLSAWGAHGGYAAVDGPAHQRQARRGRLGRRRTCQARHWRRRGAVIVRAEISRCVREVMDGPGARRIRANAVKWKEAAREAVRSGGSSNRNLGEFVEYLHATAQSRAAAAPGGAHCLYGDDDMISKSYISMRAHATKWLCEDLISSYGSDAKPFGVPSTASPGRTIEDESYGGIYFHAIIDNLTSSKSLPSTELNCCDLSYESSNMTNKEKNDEESEK